MPFSTRDTQETRVSWGGCGPLGLRHRIYWCRETQRDFSEIQFCCLHVKYCSWKSQISCKKYCGLLKMY